MSTPNASARRGSACCCLTTGTSARAVESRDSCSTSAASTPTSARRSYARTIDWVDPDRVALFGSSFSGGHVIAVGAGDPRIAAVVSQCPLTDGLASLPAIGVKNIARATVVGVRDQLSALAGRPPHYIPAVGPPGSFAVMSTPDSQPGFAALTPTETGWVNQVAGRIALRVSLYRPGRAAAKVTCPILFCVCDRDSLAPANRTLKHAGAAPRGEVKRYPVGHFEIYVGEPFEQAVADQTEFLVRTLAPMTGALPTPPSPPPDHEQLASTPDPRRVARNPNTRPSKDRTRAQP